MSPPVEIDGPRLFVRSNSLDPQELRIALLFWDRLAWPKSRTVYFTSSSDEEFLESIGVLIRPTYSVSDGQLSEAMLQLHVQAFTDLDEHEPDLWALAQGPNSLLLKNGVIESGRGALVELHRAIPVPDKDVPLNDILEFRLKRRGELMRLRQEIDAFFSSISNATDKQHELQKHISYIDIACADLLKVGREWSFPFRLSDLEVSFDMQPFGTLGAGAQGLQWGVTYGMPEVGAVVGAGASLLKISRGFGLRRAKLRSSPYRYVYNFHNEVFNA